MKMTRVLFITLLMVVGVLAGAESEEADKTGQLEEKLKQLEMEIDSLKQKATDQEIQELKQQLNILAQEVQSLRSEEIETPAGEKGELALGLGPSASNVYAKKQGIAIAGYGQVLMEDFANETQAGTPVEGATELDLLQAVLYFGYRFNDRFLFNSEIEFEHGGEEVAVEFAYIDYRYNNALSLRGGNVLLPMGWLNEYHEPTVFLGSRRPLTETFLIPSTWHENGAGFVGRSGLFDYRGYIINGFNAAGFRADGLREGRQEGVEARIDPAFAMRIDAAPRAGLVIGGSFYGGDSDVFEHESEEEEEIAIMARQTNANDEENFTVPTWIFEAHAQYDYKGFQARGLFAQANLSNVSELNETLGLTGEQSVGEELRGGYIQFGYDILAGRNKGTASLIPFFRYEHLNTQNKVPTGFLRDPSNDRTLWTIGVNFQPMYNVVLKADYQIIQNEADSGINQFNLALGYGF